MVNIYEHYIEINDIEKYTVPTIVSERVNFILGSKKNIDYTSHLQTELIIANSYVKDILEINKNNEIEYKLKFTLQKFKQDYTNAYIELLNNLPNKEEYYNHYIQNEKESNSLQNLCAIKNNFKKTCTKFKAQIRKENNKKIETYFIDGIEYYKSNHRMVYNKEFHSRHGKTWGMEELSYLCKMRPSMNWKDLSMALERTQSTCMSKYNELKKNNKINFYKNI